MILVRFTSHERRISVAAKLTGGVTVIHHDPEGWQQIARMWRLSVTEWQSAQGLEIQIPFIFDQFGYNPRTRKIRSSIEKEVKQLEALAEWDYNTNRTPIFTFDAQGAVPYDRTNDHRRNWVCGGLDLDSEYILNRQHDRCRQAGTFTALEYLPSRILRGKVMIPTQRVPKSYRIKKGDTLVKIAVYFYGDGSRWREIGKLNHIHNPVKLKPGKVIKLP
jgi:nucleoid-associated protein YgaU